jgi:hypothetical protein
MQSIVFRRKFGQGERTMGVQDSIIWVPSSRIASPKWKWSLRGLFVVAVLVQLHDVFRNSSIGTPLCGLEAYQEKEFDWYSA